MIRVELAVYLSERAVSLFDHPGFDKDEAVRSELRKTIAARDRVVDALSPDEYAAWGAWSLCHMLVEDESRLNVRPSARAS